MAEDEILSMHADDLERGCLEVLRGSVGRSLPRRTEGSGLAGTDSAVGRAVGSVTDSSRVFVAKYGARLKIDAWASAGSSIRWCVPSCPPC